MKGQFYQLDLTTQGPLYPPSEVMDEDGNFIVIGAINRKTGDGVVPMWGRAIVSPDSAVPAFGEHAPYQVIEEFPTDLPAHIGEKVLHTLPLPIPCSNYPMLFAPNQYPNANSERLPSHAFHETPIPDLRPEDGRRLRDPIRLKDWMTAQGHLSVSLVDQGRAARFVLEFEGLLPHSLYTVMSLRERDLDPASPTRPGPLGVPNVFVTDCLGKAVYEAILPDPFPSLERANANRIINIVVLWMSYQMNHGGAIGRFGLGGDIHAQLKFRNRMFDDFHTAPY